ncbi:Na+/H+ antiporter NhaA [Cellulomonas soli]|uniref:Na(+)/H(+) antiporter NhaA n=1 Tax=Cellulomonas soli TaxID=931535 RepID=A0A512PHU8_9CELL|nr:Na+/H+ antiporter NhaA [Cellulomonas soli]NYI59247.1 NhaA family Na+:H+ antiporter [Cellulomonas soli]GEP70753.1 Na(+)/H(+) antiporter NhaA [Cellulomonas soli]
MVTRDPHAPTPPPTPAPAVRRLFAALSPGAERNLLDTLRGERTGGILLLAGALAALVWANVAGDSYVAVRDTVVGPAALHLDLTVGQWATDGLLAVFFFVIGLELKREIVVGELHDVRTAVVPAVAAVGGMLVPAGLYLAVNLTADGGAPGGWAVPTATDIAFAVAVLALVGRNLPSALRAFLLTLAVVDDLLAIVVIAAFYSDQVAFGWLAASFACVAVFALVLRRGWTSPWLLLPLALAAWAFMHTSGVHATIAGVLLGFAVPASPGSTQRALRLPAPPEDSLAERFEHRWRPVSAGFAVPVFALFAAGVPLSATVVGETFTDPAAQGVALGLVLGKPLGIVAATWLVATFTRATLAGGLGWGDVLGVGLLGGIGFTVSLLVGELAFGSGTTHEHVVVAILFSSAAAAAAGSVALAARGRRHARATSPGDLSAADG